MPAHAALAIPAAAPGEAVAHTLVADLHEPRPAIFWSDLVLTGTIGWGTFVWAVIAAPWSLAMFAAGGVSAFALYRGLCFTHELTHLRRRALPGFETVWNLVFGVPLLLPSFTYVGVHQSHHSLSTYGTKDDPEYLPFASSRRMIVIFAAQSSVLIPLVVAVRFLVLAPIGLLVPPFHGWLERHASSFSMNPHYRRVVSAATARTMRRWELAMLVAWFGVIATVWSGVLPVRLFAVWYGVLLIVSFVNTVRVLGAHEYETDGTPRDRNGQLSDSIDTPGGPWTELWAPVGLRYHALHHYFPGIPYHNLGAAYRRIVATLPADAAFRESTSRSLQRSLRRLYARAKQGSAALGGW